MCILCQHTIESAPGCQSLTPDRTCTSSRSPWSFLPPAAPASSPALSSHRRRPARLSPGRRSGISRSIPPRLRTPSSGGTVLCSSASPSALLLSSSRTFWRSPGLFLTRSGCWTVDRMEIIGKKEAILPTATTKVRGREKTLRKNKNFWDPSVFKLAASKM